MKKGRLSQIPDWRRVPMPVQSSVIIDSRSVEIWPSESVGGFLSNYLIESGNRSFVFENVFLIDVRDHKLIRGFSRSLHADIQYEIELLDRLIDSVHSAIFWSLR
jgi:hypothetical protein